MMIDEQFWVAASFVILVCLGYKRLKQLMAGALDTRAAGIKKDLDDALALKEEAETLLVSYQKKYKEVQEEARQIVAHAEAEVKRVTEEASKELDEVLRRREEMVKQKIEGYQSAAFQLVYKEVVDKVLQTVALAVAQSDRPELQQHLQDITLADIKRQLH